MALSAADKREISRIVGSQLEAFSTRLTTGRQVKTAEEQALDVLVKALGKPAFPPERIVPLEEQILGFGVETAIVPTKRRKRISTFNRAVKEGMAQVKASTSYGKKGTINNSKKAFAAVTKTVSKAKRGKATAKKGILGKVARLARKRFKGMGLRGLA